MLAYWCLLPISSMQHISCADCIDCLHLLLYLYLNSFLSYFNYLFIHLFMHLLVALALFDVLFSPVFSLFPLCDSNCNKMYLFSSSSMRSVQRSAISQLTRYFLLIIISFFLSVLLPPFRLSRQRNAINWQYMLATRTAFCLLTCASRSTAIAITIEIICWRT